jgi:hypothetical protein
LKSCGLNDDALPRGAAWRAAERLEHPPNRDLRASPAGIANGMWQRSYERYDYDYAPSYGSGIGGAIYLVIGLLVAGAHNYFVHISTWGRLFSAILAVALWPLLLFGIHIHIT